MYQQGESGYTLVSVLRLKIKLPERNLKLIIHFPILSILFVNIGKDEKLKGHLIYLIVRLGD